MPALGWCTILGITAVAVFNAAAAAACRIGLPMLAFSLSQHSKEVFDKHL